MENKDIERIKCVICEESERYSENNIDGIIVNGEYICRKCEEEILEADARENKYDELVDKIKVVIYK